MLLKAKSFEVSSKADNMITDSFTFFAWFMQQGYFLILKLIEIFEAFKEEEDETQHA